MPTVMVFPVDSLADSAGDRAVNTARNFSIGASRYVVTSGSKWNLPGPMV